jgi:Bacterial regulatory proteins, gntR family
LRKALPESVQAVSPVPEMLSRQSFPSILEGIITHKKCTQQQEFIDFGRRAEGKYGRGHTSALRLASPVSSSTQASTVYDRLREDLLSGRLEPGRKLQMRFLTEMY